MEKNQITEILADVYVLESTAGKLIPEIAQMVKEDLGGLKINGSNELIFEDALCLIFNLKIKLPEALDNRMRFRLNDETLAKWCGNSLELCLHTDSEAYQRLTRYCQEALYNQSYYSRGQSPVALSSPIIDRILIRHGGISQSTWDVDHDFKTFVVRCVEDACPGAIICFG